MSRVYSDSFSFSTENEFDFVNITEHVRKIVQDSGIEHGITLVYAGHATGVIALTEYEKSLKKDIKHLLQELIPSDKTYQHPRNAFAHLRSMFLTPSKVLPVANGTLQIGTWQSLFWIEAEQRPRTRTVEVHIIGTKSSSLE